MGVVKKIGIKYFKYSIGPKLDIDNEKLVLKQIRDHTISENVYYTLSPIFDFFKKTDAGSYKIYGNKTDDKKDFNDFYFQAKMIYERKKVLYWQIIIKVNEHLSSRYIPIFYPEQISLSCDFVYGFSIYFDIEKDPDYFISGILTDKFTYNERKDAALWRKNKQKVFEMIRNLYCANMLTLEHFSHDTYKMKLFISDLQNLNINVELKKNTVLFFDRRLQEENNKLRNQVISLLRKYGVKVIFYDLGDQYVPTFFDKKNK
jgi:hypothetical protein